MKGVGIFLLLISLSVFNLAFVAAAEYTLSVNWANSQYGNVNVTPQGSSGSGGCSPTSCSFVYSNYTNGTIVTLKAVTLNNGIFIGWGGACSGTSTQCQVTMNNNKVVNATFIGNNNQTQNNTHLACVNQACVVVAGGGSNLCTSNTQCQNNTNQTHLACLSNTCTLVQGGGSNQCSPQGSTCNQTGGNQTNYLKCVNRTCTLVNGTGANQCSPAGSSCLNMTTTPPSLNNTHLACLNNTCALVKGKGQNQCSPAGTNCTSFGLSPPNEQGKKCGWLKRMFFYKACRG